MGFLVKAFLQTNLNLVHPWKITNHWRGCGCTKACNPSKWRGWRQEDRAFLSRLRYIARPCLKIRKKEYTLTEDLITIFPSAQDRGLRALQTLINTTKKHRALIYSTASPLLCICTFVLHLEVNWCLPWAELRVCLLGKVEILKVGTEANRRQMLCFHGEPLSPCEVSGHGASIMPALNLLFYLVCLEQTQTLPVLRRFPQGRFLAGECSVQHTHIPSEFHSHWVMCFPLQYSEFYNVYLVASWGRLGKLCKGGWK